jgi:predicted patatin/cPLA2 family phospholipase
MRRWRLAVLGVTLALSVTACSKVEVLAGGSGTATLNWTAVEKDTRGAQLTNLAGYKVYYGTSAGAMNTVVVLANPNRTTYVVTNLSPGHWYFTVAAYTSNGIQGLYSNTVQKTIE